MIPLPRRRLLQVSLFEILLLMTACVALIVCFQARVVPTLVYTLGFLGGLVGSAGAMSRDSRHLATLVLWGVLTGIVFGAVGVVLFEIYFPWDKWIPQASGTFATWKTTVLLELAVLRGGLGGFVATVLFAALAACLEWGRRTKAAEVDDAYLS